MANCLKRRIAEKETDNILDGLWKNSEREEKVFLIGTPISEAVDDWDEKEEGEETKRKKKIIRTYYRTGSNPDAGMDQILRAKKNHRASR